MTRKQKRREQTAQMIEGIVGRNKASDKYRADNRAVEKRKRNQFRKAKGEAC